MAAANVWSGRDVSDTLFRAFKLRLVTDLRSTRAWRQDYTFVEYKITCQTCKDWMAIT